MRIVVADDDRAIRESLERLLVREGYEATGVADGAEALRLVRSGVADLVVLDVMMPVMDGLDACRAMRAEAISVPILMLTRIEFDLLALLMLNNGIVLARTTIYEQIWGYDFGPESKNLAVYIRYLRRKIDEGHDTQLIHTVRGVGYTLREP